MPFRSAFRSSLRHPAVAAAVLALPLALCGFAHAQNKYPDANPAVTPQTTHMQGTWWMARHEAILQSIHDHPDTQLLMIGDSITNNYDKAQPPDQNFQPTWQQFYAPRKALNLGFSGDTTANVLWRLDHGEVAGLHPKVAVLLIGTNNTGWAHQTAEETETGIDAVVNDLERRLPQTHILLLGILPSDVSSEKTAADQAVNRYLATCYGENARVTYLDIGSIFYRDGKLDTSMFYDPRLSHPRGALHPATDAQHKMAEAIEPTLAKLMGDEPRMPLADMKDINTALIPVDWLEQDSYDWYARHHAELALARATQPQLVLIGDSITHYWAGPPRATRVHGPGSWQHAFGQLSVINMGFGWDRTQNVLWRLRQGEFEGMHPKWVVINIGTNNLTGTVHCRTNTPQEVAGGVSAIIDEVHQRSPQSRILLMAIFPRGFTPDSPLRAPITATNRILAARYAHDPSVTWIDIGKQFLQPDGTLPHDIMPDGTHPSDKGYELWADALIKAGVHP